MLSYVEKQENIALFEKLKQETILRYSDEIEYDANLTFYDVMISHFVAGDLDLVFVSSVVEGMSDDEKKDLFDLTREYNGLCFHRGNTLCWLDSAENALAADYDMIAYKVIDNYNYLLSVAKYGGRPILELLKELSQVQAFDDSCIVDFFRNSFIDDKALTAVLSDMSKEKSFYNIFTDEQKVALLCNPEGTLYSYINPREIRIISPLLLGAQLCNEYSSNGVYSIDEDNSEDLVLQLSEFLRSEEMSFEFNDAIFDLSSRYRDYILQKDLVVGNNNFKILYDITGTDIQKAWNCGDGVLGGSIDAPYSANSK